MAGHVLESRHTGWSLRDHRAARRGRYGEVYRATDTKLRREVAIKVLPDDLAGDHDRLARFEREAHVLAALGTFAFEVISTRGSHAKLVREPADGSRQILTVPLHRELAPGTLRAIFRQASRFIPADALRPYFFG